jgi:putative oxidoreductase
MPSLPIRGDGMPTRLRRFEVSYAHWQAPLCRTGYQLGFTMIRENSAPFAAFLLRVSLGVLFVAHALLKILVFTIPGTVEFFTSLGLPGPLAYAVIALELVGGAALIVGWYAQYFAIPLAIDLAGAIVTVHAANGWLYTNKDGGWEYPAFWLVCLIVLFLLGDGAFALKSARKQA